MSRIIDRITKPRSPRHWALHKPTERISPFSSSPSKFLQQTSLMVTRREILKRSQSLMQGFGRATVLAHKRHTAMKAAARKLANQTEGQIVETEHNMSQAPRIGSSAAITISLAGEPGARFRSRPMTTCATRFPMTAVRPKEGQNDKRRRDALRPPVHCA